MVFWSCMVYEVNPECRRGILDKIWQEAPFEYVYETHNGSDLRVFFENQTETTFGPFSEIWLDILSPAYYVRGRPPRRVPLSVSLGICFFKI